MRARARLLGFSAALLTGCSAILGVNDVFYDPGATQGGDGGSSGTVGDGGSSGTVGDGATAGDGASSACGADLQRDETNCGRCGHDCGGGKCAEGVCQPVLLAEGQRVAGLATDGQMLYATSYGGQQVLAIEKTPGLGSVKPIGGAIIAPMGVAVSGNTLYVTSERSSGSDGGLFRCTLPACGTLTRITPLDFPRHLALTGSFVFVPTESGVTRVALDGSSPVVVAAYTQPFSVAADATHFYTVSLSNSVWRRLHDGGAETEMGPRPSANNYGFITAGDDRIVWAYVDEISKKGQVLSALKSAPANRTTFTSVGAGSAGVAIDADSVYWSEMGTFTGDISAPVFANAGTLNMCPRAGCPSAGPTVLARGLRGAGQIVVDDKFVYYAELGSGSDGKISKVAKP